MFSANKWVRRTSIFNDLKVARRMLTKALDDLVRDTADATGGNLVRAPALERVG